MGRQRRVGREHQGRPHAAGGALISAPVLRGAAVAHAEETFKSHRHGLVAKLDRAYRVGKELVLVELKTRAKDVPYMKDIIELSVQRLALQEQTRTTVSMTAWVIVENPSTHRR